MSKFSSYKDFQLITESFREFAKDEKGDVAEGVFGPKGLLGTGLFADKSVGGGHWGYELGNLDEKYGREAVEAVIDDLVDQLTNAPPETIEKLNLLVRPGHGQHMRWFAVRDHESRKDPKGAFGVDRASAVRPLSDEEKVQWRDLDDLGHNLRNVVQQSFQDLNIISTADSGPAGGAPRAILAAAFEKLGVKPPPDWEDPK